MIGTLLNKQHYRNHARREDMRHVKIMYNIHMEPVQYPGFGKGGDIDNKNDDIFSL